MIHFLSKTQNLKAEYTLPVFSENITKNAHITNSTIKYSHGLYSNTLFLTNFEHSDMRNGCLML